MNDCLTPASADTWARAQVSAEAESRWADGLGAQRAIP